MNSLKPLSLFFITLFLVFKPCWSIEKKALIGYGFSDAVLPSKNQEKFYLGFSLGLKQSLKDHPDLKAEDIVFKATSEDQSPSGAIDAYKELKTKNVVGIFGFPTSHEALLIANFDKDPKLVRFFPAASHNKLGEYGPTIVTTGQPMNEIASNMGDFIEKKFPGKVVSLVVNPYAVFAKSLEEKLKATLESKGIKFHRIPLNDQQETEVKDCPQSMDLLVFTTYPDESMKALESIQKRYPHGAPIVANPSWTTGDLDFLRRLLGAWKSEVYSFSDLQITRHFQKLLFKNYGLRDDVDIAFGFDAGVIAGDVYVRAGAHNATKTSFFKAFYAKKCYTKISRGKICFKAKGGLSGRSMQAVKYHHSRFKPLRTHK
jgi:ABC-type branched-subunit amino acid transport system substrate-binding protein